MAYCPKCSNVFPQEPEEPEEAATGFCPHDGTPLVTGELPNQMPTLEAVSFKDGGAAALAKLIKHDPDAEYEKLLGTTLDGRYAIQKKLGEGGMGVVFLAKHSIIEKLVAIKVLKREVARDHSVVKRFVQEAKAASRIGHPNIVDVTDFGTTPDGMTYSVMEFVEGRTLSQVLKEDRPIALARALPIVAQIAKALAAAHNKGIVHRDLKPENVFVLDRDGRHDFVKIVDFGIAKVTPIEGNADGPRLTRAGTVFGTPEYMAPEQAAGRSDTDRRVDIYALGTILYEMLVGKVPHKAKSMVRTLAMQMLDPIPPPRKVNKKLDITDDFEQVLMKALAKKREDRYGTMEAFVTDLERVAGGVPLAQPLSASTSHKVAALSPDQATIVPAGSPTPAPAERRTPLPASKSQRQTGARTKNDPAFIGGGAQSFTHLFDDEDVGDLRKRSRWPLALAVLILFAGAGVGFALMMKSQSKRTDVPVSAADIDAGSTGHATVDASTALVREVPLDAGVVAAGQPDARKRRSGNIVRRRRPDASVGPRKEVKIQVITRPEGGTLYKGLSYRGTGSSYFTGFEGTSEWINCRLPGYKNGRVRVTYDDVNDVYLCRMRRGKKCVPGIKNPFDDCPE